MDENEQKKKKQNTNDGKSLIHTHITDEIAQEHNKMY